MEKELTNQSDITLHKMEKELKNLSWALPGRAAHHIIIKKIWRGKTWILSISFHKVCLVCEPWHNNHKGQLGVGVSFSMHRTKHFAWLVILWVSQQQGLHSEQIKPDFLQVSYLCGCSNKMHIFMTSFTYHFSESLCLASLLVMQSTMRSHATR